MRRVMSMRNRHDWKVVDRMIILHEKCTRCRCSRFVDEDGEIWEKV